jgi:predicted transposase YdaD
MKNRMDRTSPLYKEGRTEANLDVARNALAEGLPVETIQKITGLDLQAIEKLRLP